MGKTLPFAPRNEVFLLSHRPSSADTPELLQELSRSFLLTKTPMKLYEAGFSYTLLRKSYAFVFSIYRSF